MSLFELEGGRVARYREYFDTGVARLQLGFGPESLAKVLAKGHLRPGSAPRLTRRAGTR
jgi:hypothetical protein